ncbi:MAG TPA: MBL fold metallo-hydrolase [Allosphingosinicella sp.]|jgi:glyoxylase-like metal-dependent hydrolase (beta-lactamase superfamily II)
MIDTSCWQSLRGWAVAVLLGAVSCAGPAVETPVAAPSRPAALAARAADALGSARARAAAASLRAEQRGTYHAGEQSRTPADPVAEAGRVYRWWYDRSRMIREAEQLFPGGIRFHSRAALTPAGGWSVDVARWRTGTDLETVDAQTALRLRLGWERFFPHLVIAQAQAATATLEMADDGRLRFRDAVGDTVELTLDPATQRPARAALMADGVAQTEFVYSDYERRHGVLMPGRVQVFQRGTLQEDLRLGATRIARPPEGQFAAPAGYVAPPAPGEPSAREIAPGVLYFENMPGDYHSLAIDMGDHLVLVEAPLRAEYAEAQRALLERLRPGKAVRFVLVTHHHGDHVGGLAFWAGRGATIVVPAGARVAIERQLAARGYAGAARIEEVGARRDFGRFVVHAFATSHSEAHLIVHLPAERLLFQGDLFYVPARGPVPRAFPVVAELSARIDTLGLAVDRIVGVHGRVGTMAELRDSLRLAGLR